MSEPMTGAEMLARIKPKLREESVDLCLRPDLFDEWESKTEALAESREADAAGNRLASGTSERTTKLASEVLALEDEIRKTAVTFRFRALTKDKWQELCDQNPPRKGNDLDQFSGYSRDGVLDAAVRVCLIEPVFDDESWTAFLDIVNPAEWRELRNVVNSVNRATGDAPKSELASQILGSRGDG